MGCEAMYAARPSADIAYLTLSWITEQMRLEAARHELDEWEDATSPMWQRQAIVALAGGLCGIGLLLMRLCA
jgi:hypothetical protein